jgi:hypothetical protein
MKVGSFHRRALAAFNELGADEQARIQEALAPLFGTPVGQWPAAQVKKLPGDQSLYLVRIDDSLRAFVRVAAGQEPEVVDIVPRETLEYFSKAAANNGN